MLGGLERGQDFNELKDFMEYVKYIVSFGQCRSRVEEFAKSVKIECSGGETWKEAVDIANNVSTSGDTVLLSPASASWDQYKCFEDRGTEYKEIVNSYN